MADNVNPNGGQMNFNQDLSALNQFLKQLTKLSQKNVQMTPEVKSLTNALGEFDRMIRTLNRTFTGLKSFDQNSLKGFKLAVNELIKIVPKLNQAMTQFSGTSNSAIKEVNASFRLLSSTINSMQKITAKLGSPAEIDQIKSSMSSLGQIVKSFVADVNSLTLNSKNFKELNDVLKSLSQTTNAMNQAQRTMNRQSQLNNQSQLSGLNQLGLAIGRNRQQFNSYAQSFNSTGSGPLSWLNKMHMGINNVRFGFVGLVTALGGREVYNFLIGTNQQIETLQTSLEVTLKSAEKAKETINFLRGYAALTPFQELETFQAGEMLSANRMEVDRWVRVAGDLASAKRTAGVQLEDVINVLTRINSGDFGKAMIRLRQMGISLADLKSQGLEFTKNNTFEGTTEQMLDAVESIINQRFGGLTQKLGQTVEGLISTVKDFFLQLGIEMGEESFKDFKSFLIWARDELKRFRDSLDFKKLVADFNVFVKEVRKGLAPWMWAFKEVFVFIKNNLPAIGTLIKSVLYITFFNTALTTVKNIVSGAYSIYSNWQMINAATTRQNSLLAVEGGQLNVIATRLAQINALRQMGLKIATEEAALATTTNSMMLYGGPNAIRAGTKVSLSQQKVIKEAEALKAVGKTAEAESLLASKGIDPITAGLFAMGGLQTAAGATITNQVINRDKMLSLYDRLKANPDNSELLKEYDMEHKAAVGVLSKREQKKYNRINTSYLRDQKKATGKIPVALPPPEPTNGLGSAVGLMGNLARLVGPIMVAVGALVAVGAVTKMLRGDQSKNLQRTVDDWERIIEAENEEIGTLRNLNSSRQYSIDKIKYYDDMVKQNTDSLDAAKRSNDGSSEAIARQTEAQDVLNGSTQKLTEVKDQLKSTDEQIIQLSPGLINSLVNENGQLIDNTENWDLNTEAIRANIRAKQEKVQEDYKMQLATADIEKSNAEAKIKDLQHLKKKAEEYKDVGPFKGTLMGWAMKAYGVIASDRDNESIDRLSTLLKIPKDDPNYYQTKIDEIQQEIAEQEKIRLRSDKLKKEPDSLLKSGYYVTDEKGLPVLNKSKIFDNLVSSKKMTPDQIVTQINRLLNNQNVLPEFAGYEEDLQSGLKFLMPDKEKKAKVEKMNVKSNYEEFRKNPTQYLEDFLEPTKDEEKRIKARYEAQMNQALYKAGGKTDDAEYQRIQDAMYQDLYNFYEGQENEINKLKSELMKETETQIKALAKPELITLVNAGMDVDSIIKAVKQFRLGGAQAVTGEMKKFVKQLAELDKDKSFEKTYADAIDTISLLENAKKAADYELDVARGSKYESLRNTLKGEKKESTRTAYDEFTDEWEKRRQMSELQKDIALQNIELAGYDTESSTYKNTQNSQSMTVRQFLLQEMQGLQSLLSSGKIKETKEQWEAQLKLVQLQKEANGLLVDIKKNTVKLEEFNKPGEVRALTYYDYKAKDAKSTTMTINDAKFVMQINAPQTLDDVNKMMDVVQKYLGNLIKQKEFSGYRNQELLR